MQEKSYRRDQWFLFHCSDMIYRQGGCESCAHPSRPVVGNCRVVRFIASADKGRPGGARRAVNRTLRCNCPGHWELMTPLEPNNGPRTHFYVTNCGQRMPTGLYRIVYCTIVNEIRLNYSSTI